MCGGSAADIENVFQAKGGIAKREVDIGDGRVIASYDLNKVSSDEIVGTIVGSDYRNNFFPD